MAGHRPCLILVDVYMYLIRVAQDTVERISWRILETCPTTSFGSALSCIMSNDKDVAQRVPGIRDHEDQHPSSWPVSPHGSGAGDDLRQDAGLEVEL